MADSPIRRTQPTSLLVQQLEALGVRAGGCLMVHASLRKIGPIDGGAHGLLDAIMKALGDDGTLLMVLGADPAEPFTASETPVDVADMGVLAEVFRTYTGVRVNDHAAARFAAIGPLSAELIDAPPLHEYYGPGSVLQRFTNYGGHVLRLGANIDTVTLTHWAEYLAEVPNKRHVRRQYVRGDIGEQWIESLDDSDGITQWPHGDYFSQVLVDFLAAGRGTRGKVGGCTSELFGAAEFVEFVVDWLQEHLR